MTNEWPYGMSGTGQLLFMEPQPAQPKPDQCGGTVVSRAGERRCSLRGVLEVGGVPYCRHHVPRSAIRYDAVPGMRARARFAGAGAQTEADQVRLKGQLARIFAFMRDRQWRTLQGIADATDAPHASVSAQLRNLRKPEFGAHTIERRSAGDGLHEYRLTPNPRVQLALGETKDSCDSQYPMTGEDQ